MSLAFIYPYYLWLGLLIPLTIALALIGRRASSRLRLWVGLALRSLVMALIVLALAGVQFRLPSSDLTAVFVLDVSDSISQEEQARGESLIRQSIASIPRGDRAAIVVFGQNALVERLATGEETLPGLASVPVTTRTDISAALQLGMALFPDEGAKRLVLLSDGRENMNVALEQVEFAALQGIELVYMPLGDSASEVEVLIESLTSPGSVREGQEFDLTVVVESTAELGAELRVLRDEILIHSRDVSLQEGTNRFRIPVEATEGGTWRFRAEILPESDTRLQNNQAGAFTVIEGPPTVLVVEGEAGEANNLVQALEDGGMRVDVALPQNMPPTLAELSVYDSVVLVNAPAPSLPRTAMDALPVLVRELGRGLLMTGGENAFGAGGYLRSPVEDALPVEMDVRSRELSANLALVLAVDKSGSMGRCHCDNPDLDQVYTRAEVGQPKVDIAKEAIMRSASALGQQDYLGVVAFDEQPRWALEVGPMISEGALENAITSFQAEGQTNLEAGVEAAYAALEGVDARRKHVILMTDGWVREGELTELAREMQEKGITLSVIAAGEGSAEYLEALSIEGGGRYYPAQDILRVPDIFLKETVTSVGEYIIEEPFYPLPSAPSPVMRGLDSALLPALLGYNGTTPKVTARQDLITPRGDPLLASWQYGLGRAAVWTSDLKGRWATEWLQWGDFGRFATQLVSWTLPPPGAEGLAATASLEDGEAVIRLEANDEEGNPLNFLNAAANVVDPRGEARSLPLEQVGPGRYEARMPADAEGVYLVALGVNQADQSLGSLDLGFVVPYSPEHLAGGVNRGLLAELARLTGGGELLEPARAFLHNLPAADFAREVWRPLLLLSMLLFPIDVALRRLVVGREDWAKAAAWVREKVSFRREEVGERRVLGRLFEARERARRRDAVRQDAAPPATDGDYRGTKPEVPSGQRSAPSSDTPRQEEEAPSPPAEAPASQEEAMARLRDAKKRARRR